MIHYYDTWVVSKKEWEDIPLKEKYMGGIVVDGVYCEEEDEYVLITLHYENECPECHGSGFHSLNEVGFVEHCYNCEGTGSVTH